MPTHYCFQCGSPLAIQILDHHERETWPQCGWIYYPHLKLGAGVLIEQQGKILLVQRKNEPWKADWYKLAICAWQTEQLSQRANAGRGDLE